MRSARSVALLWKISPTLGRTTLTFPSQRNTALFNFEGGGVCWGGPARSRGPEPLEQGPQAETGALLAGGADLSGAAVLGRFPLEVLGALLAVLKIKMHGVFPVGAGCHCGILRSSADEPMVRRAAHHAHRTGG